MRKTNCVTMKMQPYILGQMNIYPLKSARGISVGQSAIDQRGLASDRRWMLVGDGQVFMSQRKHPRMCLIAVELDKNFLIVSGPGMEKLRVPRDLDTPEKMQVQIWEDRCLAMACSEEADIWFTRFLGIRCRLVFLPDQSIRPINAQYDINKHSVSFVDGFPFLLISEASLTDLNSRLSAPISMDRFRPNWVVKGCHAYAEDSWKKIRIGDVQFHVAKPCARCVVTTVEQTTGNKGKEPLLTLSKYRQLGGAVLFGQNLIHENLGIVKIDQEVDILS
jgi:uncharacterized protein YcbX